MTGRWGVASVLGIVLVAVDAGAASRPPGFGDFRVSEPPPAAPAPADLSSHPDARRYRTLLRRSKRDSNFAGHFTAIRIGCGSSCAQLAIVDRRNGRVFFPAEFGPMEWAVADLEDYGYTFEVTSRVVRACGDPGESGRPACRFYEWTGTSAHLVAEVPWGAVDPAGAANRPSPARDFGSVHAAPRSGRVCFERAEDGGVMNLQLVRLLASRGGSSREVAHLRGGESSCVELAGGTWSLEARSTRPYDPSSPDPNSCRSSPLRIRMEGKEVRVTVSPQSKGSAYICGWDLGR